MLPQAALFRKVRHSFSVRVTEMSDVCKLSREDFEDVADDCKVSTRDLEAKAIALNLGSGDDSDFTLGKNGNDSLRTVSEDSGQLNEAKREDEVKRLTAKIAAQKNFIGFLTNKLAS